MKHLYWIIIGLSALWLQAALSGHLMIAQIKVNFVLMSLLVMMLRWKSPFLLFWGLFLGLLMDALSHSMIGVYGMSFFITLILTRWLSEMFYDQNIFSTVLFVGVMTIVEGVTSLIILNIFSEHNEFNQLFFKVTLPLSILHGVCSIVVGFILIRCERGFNLDPEYSTSKSSSSL